MLTLTRFRINSPDVVQDTIDGEVVIVNLKSGNYYSIDNVGVEIWNLLERGRTPAEIVEFMTRQFEGTRDEVEKSISSLFEELQKEAIIVPTDSTAATAALSPDGSAKERLDNERKPTFQPPLLQKYTDMQDLLLLDPIHEVDEKGWPNANKETK